jgi:hypothetical protein
MERDLAKRFIKKDGSQRISFYRDEYAENPRNMTDEPLHCEDWSRDYSIMLKDERDNKSSNAAALLRYLLQRHGDDKKIIKALKDNYKSDKHDSYDNALSYDRSRKEWILWSWQPSWKDWQGNVNEAHWAEEWSFCTNIYDVDIYNIADYLSDETIEEFAQKYMMDGVKIMSYGFGYNGDISFYRDFSTDSEGIAWLEKDEFLKYSGCKEEYWKNNDCYDVAKWLIDELEAWSNNEVYGFVVENCIKSKIHKEYTNSDRDDECYEHEDWEESDSCWGFYGEIDKIEDDMFYNAELNKEEFEEENV